MKNLLFCGLTLTGLGIFSPHAVEAQFVPAVPAHHCGDCGLAATYCTCHTAAPVVETRYRQENVVTYRNVAETRYERQAVVEQVPVTKHEQVTVDEGSYRMVWVPKPVTRTVARTECEERVTYRDVPRTVLRQVPQVSTRLVAEPVIRQATRCGTVGHVCSTGCVPGVPTTAAVPVVRSAPTIASRPQTSHRTAEVEKLVPIPRADPQASGEAHDDWSTIRSRTGNRSAKDSPRTTRNRSDYDPVPTRTASSRDSKVPAARGKFVSAPSAATVWQYRSDTRRN